MFENPYIFGLDLYWVMIFIGIIMAVVFFRIASTKKDMSVKLYNFVIIIAAISIVVGYLSSVLFEDVYEWINTGEFKSGSGSTFYGGVIGGFFIGLSIYFLVGHFLFKDKEHIKEFKKMINLAITSVTLAHAFGRIGCLFDGCCYGKKTDSFIGINMYIDGVMEKRIPTQLFESIFLFLLFAFLVFLLFKKKKESVVEFYLLGYGIFRFLIEFVRDDDRGSLGFTSLSPSQFISLILIALGLVIFIIERVKKNGRKEEPLT